MYHYHCNNSWFAHNAFLLDVSAKNQSICSVAPTLTFKMAKTAMCNLQEQGSMLILHACVRWPQAMHALLWSYTLRTACHASNILLFNLKGKSTSERFSGIHAILLLSTTTHLGVWYMNLILSWLQDRVLSSGIHGQNWEFILGHHQDILALGSDTEPNYWFSYSTISCTCWCFLQTICFSHTKTLLWST